MLVTDGANSSFVIFLYADGGIQWTTGDAERGEDGFGGTPARVGFNEGDGIRSATVPASRTDDIVDIELTSNVGIPGVWAARIDQEEFTLGQCLICKWETTDNMLITVISYYNYIATTIQHLCLLKTPQS